VPVGGSVATRHNESDHAIELIVLDSGGRVVSRIVQTYDESGRVLNEKALTENPASLFVELMSEDARAQLDDAQLVALNKGMRTMHAQMGAPEVSYVYDAGGRLVESRQGTDLFYNRREFLYNERGDKAEERMTNVRAGSIPFGVVYSIDESGGLVPQDPQPSSPPPSFPPELEPPLVTTYAYEYDDRGNWLVLTETQQIEGGANNVVVRKRELKYF
jgi:hypothetical protein